MRKKECLSETILQNNDLNSSVTPTSTISTQISEEFSTICDCISLFKIQLSTLQQKIKHLEKNIQKDIKLRNKNKNKEKSTVKRAPSGFAKPTKVTKELCAFMERPEGSEIARTEVTRALVTYIKQHNLVDHGVNTKSNNKIIPDEKLRNLLGIQENELFDLTYFSIQKYMNKHFYSKKSILIDSNLEK
jgi:chromatin remodeling complex protein RSC6